jgi:type II secretory pathway pseudopilin PulG
MSIKDKTAVTTLELIIVIVIIAILAAIAVPVYTNRIERMRGERAIANIQLIAIAYKQYYVRNNQAPGIYGLTNVNPPPRINAKLGLELSDPYFDYLIDHGEYLGGDPRPDDTFILIIAIRNMGKHDGKILAYYYNYASGEEHWTSNLGVLRKPWPWYPE